MYRKRSGGRGFTIVELLIVIVVIAILAVITIVAYNGVQQRAQASVVQADLNQAYKKLGLYYVDNSSYPTSLSAVGINDAGGTTYQYTVDNTATPATFCVTATNGLTAYMISSSSNFPASGVCPGHTAPGGGALVPNGGVVTTLAGSGSSGFADGTGTSASFHNPYGVAVDSSGALYVADGVNNRIRKITSAGVVTTFAGSGSAAFADGTGTSASFSGPYGIAIDSSGTIYVADKNNNRIRKITSAGVVTTFAGSGSAAFADGTGTAASFRYPTGIAVDSSGTVYVADGGNNRIRKITSAGVVTTLAGSGSAAFADGTGTAASFNSPAGITVDSSGTIYVADMNNNRIRKITSSGVVTTLAGSGSGTFADGTGTAASFYGPAGITVDSSGTIYVADAYDNRIRKITSSGVVTTLAGSGGGSYHTDGTGTAAAFYYPYGIAVDSHGTLYVVDWFYGYIRVIR